MLTHCLLHLCSSPFTESTAEVLLFLSFNPSTKELGNLNYKCAHEGKKCSSHRQREVLFHYEINVGSKGSATVDSLHTETEMEGFAANINHSVINSLETAREGRKLQGPS